MFTFELFSKTLREIKDIPTLSKFLESAYIDLETYLEQLDTQQLEALKFKFEDLLYDLEDNKLIQPKNPPIVNAFLVLLSQKFEQVGLIGAITIVLNYLPDSGVKKRLEAAKLYLKVNDLSKDYHQRFETIIGIISSSLSEDESDLKAVHSVGLYFMSAMSQFARIQSPQLLASFKQLFLSQQKNYPLLKHSLITQIVTLLSIENFAAVEDRLKDEMFALVSQSKSCEIKPSAIVKEEGPYAQQLYALKNPCFTQLREISYQYIQQLGDPQILFDGLQRGEAIIEDEALLHKYIVSFGAKHKAKLESAFDEIIHELQGDVSIIDWGCGQAFATMMFLEYIKHKKLNLTIKTLCLIEPSKKALSRGLLHIDVLKPYPINIKPINSDLDCLNAEELYFDSECKIIHLFSNILDIEGFKLNTDFFNNVATAVCKDTLFVCTSPNINDKRNTRLDLFYNYFDENFDTSLISSRNSDINGHKRYEKIFSVKLASQEIPEIQATLIAPHIYQTLLGELSQFKHYISPILDVSNLESAMQNDPEYIIYKVRKVAETLTTKIYSSYESNADAISFSDKIRYLSYEKKVLTKTIKNYLQTIRTIGNVGVHEDRKDFNTQQYDAHMMLFALISLVKELCERKFI